MRKRDRLPIAKNIAIILESWDDVKIEDYEGCIAVKSQCGKFIYRRCEDNANNLIFHDYVSLDYDCSSIKPYKGKYR